MKLSNYVTIIKQDNKYLLFNSMYNSAILVHDRECLDFIDKISNRDQFIFDKEDEFQTILFDNKIIYDNNEYDELNLLKLYIENYEKKRLNIIPIVTRKCNFRCPYCYEDHDNNFVMNDLIFDSIVLFIEKMCKINNPEVVDISFFGGEPTLEIKNIVRIMNVLKSKLNGRRVMGSMTTNGFLLTEDNFSKLINANVTSYQITIDGLKQTHDKSRYLINQNGTWEQIIDNLLKMKSTNYEFNVVIRTNYTNEILEYSSQYLNFLSDNFGNDPRFSFHFEAVKNLGGDINVQEIDFSNDDKKATDLFLKKAMELGLLNSYSMFEGLGRLMCYASSKYSYIIDYDGTIKKCTVTLDDYYNSVGKINNGSDADINLELLSNWTSYELREPCKKCEILPICFGRKCPNSYYNNDICEHLKYIYKARLQELYLNKKRKM